MEIVLKMLEVVSSPVASIVLLVIGLLLSYKYILLLVTKFELTTLRAIVVSVIFVLCVVFVGSVDLGSIAAFTTIVSSVLIISPLHARDLALSHEDELALNIKPILLVVIVFTGLLGFESSASVLKGFSETDGVLITYSFLGFLSSLLYWPLWFILVRFVNVDDTDEPGKIGNDEDRKNKGTGESAKRAGQRAAGQRAEKGAMMRGATGQRANEGAIVRERKRKSYQIGEKD